MTNSTTPILFLNGAGLPDWLWDDVRDRLEQRETRVAARPAAAQPGLADYAEAALADAPSGRFTVVAHSAGGVVAAALAQLAPDRVDAVLGVAAVVPAPGGSFLTALPRPQRWVLDVAMRLAGTRPPAASIRRGLAHGLPAGTADRIVAEFRPESAGLYRDRVGTDGPDGWAGRSGYVHTLADRELPLALQRPWAERLGGTFRAELETGHLPMLEDPASLATSIAAFVDQKTETCTWS